MGRMSDLISRQAVLKHIEKIRQDTQMMDDIRKASIIMNGMYLCEEAVKNQPSVDAIQVVRCNECRYGYKFFDVKNGITDSWVECRNPDGLNRDVSEDNFCGCGDQKDDGNG